MECPRQAPRRPKPPRGKRERSCPQDRCPRGGARQLTEPQPTPRRDQDERVIAMRHLSHQDLDLLRRRMIDRDLPFRDASTPDRAGVPGEDVVSDRLIRDGSKQRIHVSALRRMLRVQAGVPTTDDRRPHVAQGHHTEHRPCGSGRSGNGDLAPATHLPLALIGCGRQSPPPRVARPNMWGHERRPGTESWCAKSRTFTAGAPRMTLEVRGNTARCAARQMLSGRTPPAATKRRCPRPPWRRSPKAAPVLQTASP